LSRLEEFTTEEAENGAEALARAKDGQYNALLLDVGLPDMDGREVCRLLRRAGFAAPVIMLTGADTDSDTVLGLEAGANDYVTKPFRFNVLLARLRAQLRLHEQSEEAVFTIGRFTFRPSQKVLVEDANKRKIHLTEKETAILKYLYRTGGQVVGREKLLVEVWGFNAAVTTHTLETHVYRLRQKIEKDPSRAEILITEQGGYRLVP
jgi:DNA-binding response OmpR family regulator